MISQLEKLEEYAARFTSEEPPLLKQLREETYKTQELPQMIAGHLQGRFLAMLTRLSGAKRVLEIGTFVGYSALCFAEALPEEGEVITLDSDPGVREITKRVFAKVAYGSKIILKIGEALKSIQTLPGPFDLVYIDADKENYGHYYDAVFDKIPSGGIILADNLLWGGRVLDPKEQESDTQALRTFAAKVAKDSRVEAVLLTVRDGLYLIRKK
jgi:caffeoyl-CoA O-methyltransferase